VFEDSGQQDPFYAMQQSQDCSGELLPGEVKTCTVTNDDVPFGTLIVKKHVINDNGGTKNSNDFHIFVVSPTGRAVPSEFEGSESGTEVKVAAGAYNVTEQVRPGTYTVQRSPDCEGEIGAGQTKTCTVTNDDTGIEDGKLIVKKHVINDNGGTKQAGDFFIFVKGKNALPDSFPGSENGTEVLLSPGEYNVSESKPSPYISKLSEDCSGTIASGQVKTCTITNDDSEDTSPPQVLSFELTPNPDGRSFNVTAHLTDNIAIERSGIFVQDDCGCGQGGFFQTLQLSLVSGTPQDGIWAGTFVFPDDVPPQPTDRQFYQVGGSTQDTSGNVQGFPLRFYELTK
jgi:hypothetical protein